MRPPLGYMFICSIFNGLPVPFHYIRCLEIEFPDPLHNPRKAFVGRGFQLVTFRVMIALEGVFGKSPLISDKHKLDRLLGLLDIS